MKVGVAYINVHISRHLKQELAMAIDKWLRLLVIQCYLKQLYHQESKEYSCFKLKDECMHYYVALSIIF